MPNALKRHHHKHSSHTNKNSENHDALKLKGVYPETHLKLNVTVDMGFLGRREDEFLKEEGKAFASPLFLFTPSSVPLLLNPTSSLYIC